MSSDKRKKTKNPKTSSVLVNMQSNTLEPLPVSKILLLALLKKHSNSSGYDLMQKVTEFSNGQIHLKSGSIYPILREFEGLNLVTSKQQTFGRKRRLYTLTEKGKRELTILGKLIRKRSQILMNPLLEIIESG